MTFMAYQCVDCRRRLSLSEGDGRCSGCGRIYERRGAVLLAWPTRMHDLSRDEAAHHDHEDADQAEVHQLGRPRNRHYHEALWKKLRALPPGENLLEIGAGSGYDAAELVSGYSVVLSDVSPETLARLERRLGSLAAGYVAADGSRLPFADASFGGVYMVATWHHLPYPGQGLAECARVLRPGGLLVIGLEPNAFYFRPIKLLRRLLCRLTHMDPGEGSHADAEMEGFSYRGLALLFRTGQWQEVEIRPAWLLCGLWHYLAEFLYRACRLPRRLVLPDRLEKFLVKCDEALFRLPGVKHLGWHWNVTARRAVR
ncbi:MAG: Methyltransferase type 11 [Candidatus Magasanikbacteria bacterium GW2011_GWA2_56_11]|uniref:Methyltransferase type 11 n=1 Tax=Candidatus Magasanikbacteria bacterium GW2011_GWA2_56_11 TaxID=1619044 RepID=A0A0G2B8J9_9BACT|nr:MAG: Methyltransferase type 11 [Candidatus Magasanikbacteria bacterium GW2011_GWA2_56_11]